jgi:ABC-type spermidine/putrescine transport system permease subunit II
VDAVVTRVLGTGFVLLCGVFFVAPIAEVVLTSLAPNVTSTAGVTGTQYASFFRDPQWTAAWGHSLELAAVVALVATATGLLVAVGIARVRNRPVRLALEMLAVAPLILPAALMASALFEISIAVHLYGTFLVAVGQVILATPWAYLFLRAGLARLDPSYALAALTLGDSRAGVLLRIWIPLLGPYLVVAAAMAAATSLSDPLMPVLLGSVNYPTLAQLTWDSLQHGIDNRTAVGATLILATVALLLAVAVLLRRLALSDRSVRRQRQEETSLMGGRP